MNQKITLPDVAEWVARRRGCSKREAELFLREMVSLTAETLAAGEVLKIEGLGLFKPVWVEPRTTVNVQTGEPFLVPGHYKLVFTPEKRVREAVNEPFSCFSAEVLPDDADLLALRVTESAQPDEDVEDLDDESGSDEAVASSQTKAEPSQSDAATDVPSEPAVVAEQPADPIEEEPVQAASDDLTAPAVEPEPSQSDTTTDIPSEPAAIVEQSVEPAEEASDDLAAPAVEPEPLQPDTTTDILSEPAVVAEQPAEPTEAESAEAASNRPEAAVSSLTDEEASDVSSPENMNDLLRRERMRGFWIGAVVAATITVFVLFSVYIVVHRPFASVDEAKGVAAEQVTVPATTADTVAALPSESGDTTRLTDSVDNRVAVAAVQPASAGVVKDTLGRGEFLTTLSLKHYGHKAFWVYIYDANKNIISNPDNVEAGTVLTIPPREKYGIEAADSVSVRKALNIADSLKAKR